MFVPPPTQTPGVRMASILVLPNLGSEPKGYTLSFSRTPDRSANAKATLEAFWYVRRRV